MTIRKIKKTYEEYKEMNELIKQLKRYIEAAFNIGCKDYIIISRRREKRYSEFLYALNICDISPKYTKYFEIIKNEFSSLNYVKNIMYDQDLCRIEFDTAFQKVYFENITTSKLQTIKNIFDDKVEQISNHYDDELLIPHKQIVTYGPYDYASYTYIEVLTEPVDYTHENEVPHQIIKINFVLNSDVKTKYLDFIRTLENKEGE